MQIALPSNRHAEIVRTKALQLIQDWSNLYGDDPSLATFRSSYDALKMQGVEFPEPSTEAPTPDDALLEPSHQPPAYMHASSSSPTVRPSTVQGIAFRYLDPRFSLLLVAASPS